MRTIHESSQSYLINQYFVHAKLEQEMMHISKHRFFLAGLPKLLLSRWYQPRYEPLESHTIDPSSQTYELNKLNLMVYILIFVMFHDDGKIDQKEMKLLKRYTHYVKMYHSSEKALEIIEFLKITVSMDRFQSIYIQKGYLFPMFKEALYATKKLLTHQKYVSSFEILEQSVKSL
jgi:heme oxygenase